MGVIATPTWGTPQWQPCKQQCDDNFAKNDLAQSALVSVCERGCDLFTVALISTPQRAPVLHLGPVLLPPKPPVRTSPHDLVVKVEKTQVTKVDKEANKKHQSSDNSPNFTRIAPVKFSQIHQKSRQTTTQPADHPVQDHPAQAAHQVTTTHTPVSPPESSDPKPEKETEENTEETNNITSPPKEAGHNGKVVETRTIIIKEDKSEEDKNHEKETKVTKPGIGKVIKVIHKELAKLHEAKKGSSKGEKDHNKPKAHQKITIVSGTDRLEQAKHSCRHACGTAYNVAAEQEACVVGCHLQATTAFLQPPHSSPPQPSPSTPLAIFQHVMFSLAGHVGRLVRVTWAWTSGSQQEPQEKIQVYGSESRSRTIPITYDKLIGPIMVTQPEEVSVSKTNVGLSLVASTRHHEEHISSSHHLQQQQSNQQQQQQQQPQQQQTQQQQQQQQNQQSQLQQTLQQQQLDLLECISRKSGLPRWFIAVTIFTSALVILWLCFTLTAPPDDIKVVKTKPPELEMEEDEEEFEEEDFSCSEKKKLLAQADDVIKIRIENV